MAKCGRKPVEANSRRFTVRLDENDPHERTIIQRLDAMTSDKKKQEWLRKNIKTGDMLELKLIDIVEKQENVG